MSFPELKVCRLTQRFHQQKETLQKCLSTRPWTRLFTYRRDAFTPWLLIISYVTTCRESISQCDSAVKFRIKLCLYSVWWCHITMETFGNTVRTFNSFAVHLKISEAELLSLHSVIRHTEDMSESVKPQSTACTTVFKLHALSTQTWLKFPSMLGHIVIYGHALNNSVSTLSESL